MVALIINVSRLKRKGRKLFYVNEQKKRSLIKSLPSLNETTLVNFFDEIDFSLLGETKTRDVFDHIYSKTEKRIILFLNKAKVESSNTSSKNGNKITINNQRFDEVFMSHLAAGISAEKFEELFPYIRRINGAFYYFDKNGNSLNNYYFDMFEYNAVESGIAADMEAVIEAKEKDYGDKKMGKMTNTVKNVVEMNKSAGKQAALVKIGKTANHAVIEVLQKKVIPKKYKKIVESPFFGLAIANVSAVAMKEYASERSDGAKVEAVADAMLLSSMLEITDMIDLNKIITDVIESVDLKSLGFSED